MRRAKNWKGVNVHCTVYTLHTQSKWKSGEQKSRIGKTIRNKSNSKESVELNSLFDSLLACVFMYIWLRFSLSLFCLAIEFLFNISCDIALCTVILASHSNLLIVPVIDIIVCPFEIIAKLYTFQKRLSIHSGN